VSAYRGSDGALVGTLLLRADPSDPEIFETVNTPCVRGDRVYVATQRTNDPASTARLVAIDVHDGAPSPSARRRRRSDLDPRGLDLELSRG